MKSRKGPIVSVTSRKIDPREHEARILVEWLKTLPVGNESDANVYQEVLATTNDRDNVRTLMVLANYLFDLKTKDTPYDFLRVYCDAVETSVTYMEHFNEGEAGKFFTATQIQCFDHVVDAFICLKNRYTSEHPAKAAYHACN